ncbi:MAG: hypothetical protein JWO30_4721 [Fibrobacteres bacterium]|nr:hypothetical protein [Fibrobacterota bacterium]
MGVQKDKLTEAQKKEIERLRSFVSRNRLSTQMNGTKWRAAIDAIQGIEGYRASFRFRGITDAEDPPADRWNEGFPENIPLYNSIEWLELNARSAGAAPKDKKADVRAAIWQALEAAGIPIAESATGVRIVGYTRPGR